VTNIIETMARTVLVPGQTARWSIGSWDRVAVEKVKGEMEEIEHLH
jgi:hypothetical protein